MPIFSHNGIFLGYTPGNTCNKRQGVSPVVSFKVQVKTIEPFLD